MALSRLGVSPRGGPLATQRITMKAETRRHLVALNRRFYEHHGQAFDGSRQRPWRGWQRLVDLLQIPTSQTEPATESSPLRVLDAGCGNGRLATYLQDALSRPLQYVGVDSSPELLAQAAQRSAAGTLIEADLLSGTLDEELGEQRFDLVTCFGVLHHVPDLELRLDLLRRLGRRCRPGGLLVVSVWRLDRQPRFAKKVLPWAEYLDTRSHQAHAPGTQDLDLQDLDMQDLEPGDVLLTWSGDRHYPRYCHFPEDRELDRWREHLPWPLLDRWSADGADNATNLYLAWRC